MKRKYQRIQTKSNEDMMLPAGVKLDDIIDGVWSWCHSSTLLLSGAVCLMDRLFGKTGLRAAFPAFKTFRDTRSLGRIWSGS